MSLYKTIIIAGLAGVGYSHCVILGAQGIAGSPSSVGFQVDPAIARNCTSISPCQQDATIIRDAEIAANIVNQCGRTELTGNIDVGENTENALAAGAVTQVQKGTVMTVTIHQVNADGAGPFVCDLDETGNSGLISQNLTVTDNVPGKNGFSQAKTQQFEIKVTMPDQMACTGGSTGDICTVRCRNNAVAGPFGGCFAVQQTDTTPKVNTPENIATLQALDPVLAQVQQNKEDLPAAIKANQNAGSDPGKQGQAAVDALLQNTIVTSAFPQETPERASGVASAPAATQSADAGRGNGGNGNGRNGNNNAGNGNGNGNNGANRNGNNGGNAKNNAGAGAAASSSATSSAAAAATSAATGGNRNGKATNNDAKNNNDRRSGPGSLRWARRIVA